MNESHVIDSWIAELGLSGRRARRAERTVRPTADPRADRTRAGGEATALVANRPVAVRYQVISSPC